MLRKRIKARRIHRHWNHATKPNGDTTLAYDAIAFTLEILITFIAFTAVFTTFYVRGDIFANPAELGYHFMLNVFPFAAFSFVSILFIGNFLLGISRQSLFGLDSRGVHDPDFERTTYTHAASYAIGAAVAIGAGSRWHILWNAYADEHPFATAVLRFTQSPSMKVVIVLIAFLLSYLIIRRIVRVSMRIRWNIHNTRRQSRIADYTKPTPTIDPLLLSSPKSTVLWLSTSPESHRGTYAISLTGQLWLLPSGSQRPAEDLSRTFPYARQLSPARYPIADSGTLGIVRNSIGLFPFVRSTSGWWRTLDGTRSNTPGQLDYFAPPAGSKPLVRVN
jgi:hypothetical protein